MHWVRVSVLVSTVRVSHTNQYQWYSFAYMVNSNIRRTKDLRSETYVHGQTVAMALERKDVESG